ncbi:MAG: hypothetical protein M3093_01250 [Thermoproteota archaeon]|nr:hypothetical protein [Thermoproteota archaeon]
MENLYRLVEQARSIVVESGNPDKFLLWRAYVALECAILDLKLHHSLEGNSPPKHVKSADLDTARSMIGRIDVSSQDKRKLLSDLRLCRDIVKAVVASRL